MHRRSCSSYTWPHAHPTAPDKPGQTGPPRPQRARPAGPAPPPHAPHGRARIPRPARAASSGAHHRHRPAAAEQPRPFVRHCRPPPEPPAPARPCASHSRALSNPETACPARRAKPEMIRRSAGQAPPAAPMRDRRAPRPGHERPWRRRPLARARSSTSARALNHKPRPGRLCRKVGHEHAGPGRPRSGSSAAFGARSRVTMQRRSGPVSGASSSRLVCIGRDRGARQSWRASAAGRRRGGLAFEPVRPRGHDDLVGGRLVDRVRAKDFDAARREARSARSSSVFTPFSPSVTSIAGVSVSIAATSSVTPSSRRARLSSSSRRISKLSARRISSSATLSSKPSISASSSRARKPAPRWN